MSRIGKQPVVYPNNVKVRVADGKVFVEGPKGKLELAYHPNMAVAHDEKARSVTVTRPDDERLNRALHGLTRSLINNMVKGVTLGYEKRPYAPDQYKGPGAFVRVVVWRLHNAGPAANGYIVQKVKNTYNFGPCGGEATSRVEVYWEAWKVSGGKIVTGATLGLFPQDGDEFGMDASPRTKGMKMKEGWAKYLADYTAPDGWGTEAFAHAGTSMPSTFREPGPPWSEQGAIYRWYRIVYDDCGANTSRFESFDGDPRPVVE